MRTTFPTAPFTNLLIYLLLCLLALVLTACQTSLSQPLVSTPSSPGGSHAATSPLSTQPKPTFPPTPTGTPSPGPSPRPPSDTPLPPPSSPTPTPTVLPNITLLFTGQIVPARCVQAEIDARGSADYIYDELRHLLTAADLTVGTYNASMSDYPPHTGCISTFRLVSGPENADAMARAGFDVMSVATNHIKNCGVGDCGDRAFLDTLSHLNRVGILPVGAGENHAEAMQAVVVEVQGVKFGIVSLGQIETTAFAGEHTPGIAVLNEENLRAAIAAARQDSDVVIAMPHWGPEYASIPNYDQRGLARAAVEAGADLVVGNHTHVVQAVQEIDGVLVFYGLGNFVFDQDWSRETQQSVILTVTFEGARLAAYTLTPVYSDGNGTLHLADPVEAAEILERMEAASRGLR